MNTIYTLEQTMRWYGVHDAVPLAHIAQAGCTGVVSALHHIPVGEVWTIAAIETHKKRIEEAGLSWTVVESLPVHEDIKTRSANYLQLLENYKQSLINLAACGIKVVTYNFMPILDWLRTDIAHVLPDQSEALLFNRLDYAVFDLFLLKRPGAENDYSAEDLQAAEDRFHGMTEPQRRYLFQNVLLGLPGSDIPFTPEEVLTQLRKYSDIGRIQLKQNLIHFLQAITPTAEAVGLQMAIHPDDPPFSVLGLPRIMSTATDIQDVMEAVPSMANGLCFCTGSFGARADNDLLAMVRQWGARIYFLHLRNTKRDEFGNFMEANHLEGDADMYGLMLEIVNLMQKERRRIPMRPDHGHKMLDDLGKKTYPGYSAIGRLKGLAELRGLEYAVFRFLEKA
ncbi:MAG TPA: mannonate dehydratase [Saprospiraceae bacterium]|nr:mannonate dehydratase [Saprospiraceae bacterium]HMQ81698.1 mannonate dehydratase [Saprospiraceae bacterium]